MRFHGSILTIAELMLAQSNRIVNFVRMFKKDFLVLEIRHFFTAMTFLTRIPVSKLSVNNPYSLLNSSVYFPLIGIVIGLLIAITFAVSKQFWNTNIAVILSLAIGVLLTGAFHEDGFADVCDAMGAFDKEKKLEIMKDSRLGTYGVTALICLFLLKFSLLSSIADDEQNLFGIFILAHCLSRWSSLPLIYLNPYVSRNAKSGKDLIADATNETRLALASIFCLIMLLIFGWGNVITLILGLFGVLFISQIYFRKSVGGITGDCLGATNQLTELMVYLVFAVQ